MKELVGKIYRDENGVETIEREVKKHTKILWDVELNNVDDRPHPYGVSMRCPECGKVCLMFYNDVEARTHFVNRLLDLRNNRYCYCGYCGHRNIFEVEI